MYDNITEIKAANKAAGHYWFDEPCRAETPIQGGCCWVESRPGDDYHPGRRYSAVHADDQGHVFWCDPKNTVVDTHEQAQEILDAFLANHSH